MLSTFRTYKLAVEFYSLAKARQAPSHLRDQLLRASSSVVLNLSEGSAKKSPTDRRRFYEIALASMRECEAIIELLGPNSALLLAHSDKLARHLYRLVHSLD